MKCYDCTGEADGSCVGDVCEGKVCYKAEGLSAKVRLPFSFLDRGKL